MGNYISCTLAPAMMKNAKAARVIFPTGEVKQFKETVKAAELMLECPNFFCANSTSLHIGRRFSALSADEELEFGNVYIMFPLRRVHSFVTAGDMGLLFVAANSVAKRISGGKVRVLPEAYVRKSSQGVALDKARSNNTSELNSSTPRLSLDGISEFQHKLLICRSRKPLLETINEEPVVSIGTFISMGSRKYD